MNGIAWNCRDAGGRTYPRTCQELIHRYDCVILTLFEMRLHGTRAAQVCNKIGFLGCCHSEAVGFSGGIWVCWDERVVEVDVLNIHNQLIHARISPRDGSYACLVRDPWVVLGDFNAYLFADGKSGGGPPNRTSMWKFSNCLNDCRLMDLGLKGPPFTWEWHGVRERLDRAVGNMNWRLRFSEASVVHLPALKSDHMPILLKTQHT